ncbi:hypothetical protein L0F63_006856 [Massospora cicadina]|nr:hypothetical protein L0F63_006856 [Massospora cicadina]
MGTGRLSPNSHVVFESMNLMALAIEEEDLELYYSDHPHELRKPKVSTGRQAILTALDAAEVAIQAASPGSDLFRQACVVKAKALFYIEEYSKAKSVLQPLELLASIFNAKVTGYSKVSYIQGLLLEGLEQEFNGNDITQAVKLYEAASHMISLSATTQADDRTCAEFQKAAEDALYRLPLLQIRTGESGLWAKRFRTHKQLVILRYFLVVLAQLYQRGEHVPCVSSTAAPTTDAHSAMSIYSPEAFRDEMSNIQTRYEALVYTLERFPKADAINFRVLDMADTFVANWALLKNSRAMDTKDLAESLYRAAMHTYQSPRLLRHLTTVLIALGEYEEARLAMEAYVQRIEKAVVPCILDAAQEQETFSEFTIDSAELVFRRQVQPTDKERLSDVVATYLVGARLCIQEFDQYTRAVELAELAITRGLSRPSHHPRLMSRAKQYLGVAQGYLSMRADNPSARTTSHELSLAALNQAIAIDGDNWEAHFFLALQLAESREIKEAIVSVKRSIELQPAYAPSWHLLVLLLSSQKQYSQAISVCELAIREAEYGAELEAESTGDTVSGLLTTNLDGEDLLSLKTTLNCLQDAALGTKVAINHHGSLFALYAKVYGSAEPNPSEELPKLANSTFPRMRDPTLRPASVANTIGHATFPYLVKSRGMASSYGLHVSTRSLPRLLSRRKQGVQVLVLLWLHSAEAYRRLGRFEDARLATEEAEQVDAASPDVWCQYGKNYLAQKMHEAAHTSLQRALILDPDHLESLIAMAQYYTDMNELDQAEACLRAVTTGCGWHSAQGWFLLGKVYRLTQRAKQAQTCMLYALDLDLATPIRPFHILRSLRNIS